MKKREKIYEPIGKVIAGWGHSALMSIHGKVYMCGRNCKGQLGLGDVNKFPLNERQHQYSSTFRRVRIGVEEDEDEDEVEKNEKENEKENEENDDDDEEIIIDVACGGEHTCLLSESGKVYTFGQACQGQLGLYDWNQHGKIPAVDQPRAVECLGRAKGLSVTAGNACTIVMMLRPEPPSLVDICKGVLTMIREERIVLDDNIYKKTKK